MAQTHEPFSSLTNDRVSLASNKAESQTDWQDPSP